MAKAIGFNEAELTPVSQQTLMAGGHSLATNGGVSVSDPIPNLGGGDGDVFGDDTTTVIQNIVAYSTTGGKNITELTGTQGDVLYHNGTSWVKLGAGDDGAVLTSGGVGANPSWGKIIDSDSYVPAIADLDGLSAGTCIFANYIRVGSVVTVTAQITLSVTNGSTAFCSIAFPIATNNAAKNSPEGVGVFHGNNDPANIVVSAYLGGGNTGKAGVWLWDASVVNDQNITVVFQYMLDYD